MKLTFTHAVAINNHSESTDYCSQEIRLYARGESRETYVFPVLIQPNITAEESLRRLADEIENIRRQRPRPTYKVKSLMPKEWKKTPKTASEACQEEQGARVRPKEFTYDPTKAFGQSVMISAKEWGRFRLSQAKQRLIANMDRLGVPADAQKRAKWFKFRPDRIAPGIVGYRINPKV